MSEPVPVSRAMVIVAHPDDPEFTAGGTVALWTERGVEVAYCVVSDGSKGSDDRSLSPERLAALRIDEQREAAAALGVAEVRFLGFKDGEIEPDRALRTALAREIRRFRPEAVVTHDPARIYFDDYINHPDHRAVGEAALAAIFPTARDHLSAPELLAAGLEPHKVRLVYLTGAVQPDIWIDISSTIDRKIAALRLHVTQIGDPERLADRVRQRAAAVGDGHGVALAEAFKRIAIDR